jgi:hypothetical protein
MSFAIVIMCPSHPTYTGKVRPATGCNDCRLVFGVRNETNKALSAADDEKDPAERIISEIVD